METYVVTIPKDADCYSPQVFCDEIENMVLDFNKKPTEKELKRAIRNLLPGEADFAEIDIYYSLGDFMESFNDELIDSEVVCMSYIQINIKN